MSDDGHAFSDKIISNLAPLIALFGDTLVRYLISKVMGLRAVLQFANAPFGIPTIMASAVRTAGPVWMKLIFSSAGESPSAVELSIMTSTSSEVCELWDGHQIVRTSGKGQIVEFINILPDVLTEEGCQAINKAPTKVIPLPLHESLNGTLELEQPLSYWARTTFRAEILVNWLRRIITRQTRTKPDLETQTQAQNQPGHASQALTIVGRTESSPDRAHGLPAPSILANLRSRPVLAEWVVCFGLGYCLQCLVFAYMGWNTYHPLGWYQLDGKDVQRWSFWLFFGSSLTSSSMATLLVWIVDQGSRETVHKPAEGMQATPVCLQRQSVVGDKHFGSYAIFRTSRSDRIVKSSRAPPPSALRRALTTVGVTGSVASFVAQFMSLANNHWTATLLHVGVSLLCLIIKLWLTRHVTTLPGTVPLTPGFELEWYAMVSAICPTRPPWVMGAPGNHGWETQQQIGGRNAIEMPWDRPGSVSSDQRGQQPQVEVRKASELPGGRPWSLHSDQGEGWDWIVDQIKPDLSAADRFLREGDPGVNLEERAHKCMTTRHSLGQMSGQRGGAYQQAIQLARACEAVLNSELMRGKLLAAGINARHETLFWPVRVGQSKVYFKLTWQRGAAEPWTVSAGELDAFLSLQQYRALHDDHQKQPARKTDARLDDAWLRGDGEAETQYLHVVCPWSPELSEDFSFWVGGSPEKLVSVVKAEGQDYNTVKSGMVIKRDVETRRIAGIMPGAVGGGRFEFLSEPFSSQGQRASDRSDWLVGYMNTGPLEDLWAQHLFHSFIHSLANSLESPLVDLEHNFGEAMEWSDTVQWFRGIAPPVAVRSMLNSVEETGLGPREAICSMIVPTLIAGDKLLSSRLFIDDCRKFLGSFSSRRKDDALRQLHSLLRCLDPANKSSFIEATAMRMEIRLILARRGKMRPADLFVTDSEQTVLREMCSVLPQMRRIYSREVLKRVIGLDEARSRLGVSRKSNLSSFRFTAVHLAIWESNIETLRQEITAHPEAIHEHDILGWTPLHLAALRGDIDILDELWSHEPRVDAKDLQGRTPLHISQHHRNRSIEDRLLDAGARTMERDFTGLTPEEYERKVWNGQFVLSRLDWTMLSS